jgi:hypothetical protein
MQQKISKEFLVKLKKITAKRARTVIDHIIEHGFITTEELESTYGYAHAPRAARDVREEGIPLETFSVKNSAGRSIAAYKFGDISKISKGKLGGREAFSKEFKKSVININSTKCSICCENYEERYLQIDHRIPYEVAGDNNHNDLNIADYMPICGSCNRAKSWSCENCRNWIKNKDSKVCQKCYWANPSLYEHIAMRSIRRLDIMWSETEISDYDAIKEISLTNSEELPLFVKRVLKKHIDITKSMLKKGDNL